ncbi:pseudouridine synthase [Rickettsiaceae bacterium]|nr:pseudouridine synthase [Rickettsiaceae bacterium]
MRIARFIAKSGLCSRRDAERLILEGKVSVDRVVINSPALNVSEHNVITVSSKKIEKAQEAKMWLYYKPVGLITTHKDPQNRHTVFDALKDKLPSRVISVGRLDINSEGLLLLTNDSDIARYFESPKNKVERIYKVRAFGASRPINIQNKKIVIDDIIYKPKSIKLISKNGANSWYEVILTEGKNREVRKIFSHFGFEVNRLIRTKFGQYELGDMKPSEYRMLKLP